MESLINRISTFKNILKIKRKHYIQSISNFMILILLKILFNYEIIVLLGMIIWILSINFVFLNKVNWHLQKKETYLKKYIK